MTIALIKVLSLDEATSRIAELNRRIGDVDDFRARGAVFALDAQDAALYDELRDLEFLLGES